jgi:hypothetical protein
VKICVLETYRHVDRQTVTAVSELRNAFLCRVKLPVFGMLDLEYEDIMVLRNAGNRWTNSAASHSTWQDCRDKLKFLAIFCVNASVLKPSKMASVQRKYLSRRSMKSEINYDLAKLHGVKPTPSSP